MKIEKLYDNIAGTYNQKASADVLSEANNTAFSLITRNAQCLESILALGVGDGVCLLPYKEFYPASLLYGLDVSENMLRKAKTQLNCQVYHGDIAKASSLINKNNFDLILAHFVCAYVPISISLGECKKIMSERGLVSIVTNTLESFAKMQEILRKMKKSPNPFNRLVSYHIKQALKTVYVPDNLDHLRSIFVSSGLTPRESHLVEININLKTEKEVFEFFIDGGWFASGLMHPLLPKRVFHNIIKRLIHEHVRLPYEDNLQVAIVVGSK